MVERFPLVNMYKSELLFSSQTANVLGLKRKRGDAFSAWQSQSANCLSILVKILSYSNILVKAIMSVLLLVTSKHTAV